MIFWGVWESKGAGMYVQGTGDGWVDEVSCLQLEFLLEPGAVT